MQLPHLLSHYGITGISLPFTATQILQCRYILWTFTQQRGFYREEKGMWLQGICSLIFMCFQRPPQHRGKSTSLQSMKPCS